MPGARRGRIALLALLALAGGIGMWYSRSRGPLSSSATSGSLGASPSRRLALLENSLRAVAEGERTASREHWDPEYVIGVVGTDPQRLADWVREQTRWIPYHGVLRGAAGVLMDREGNSLDRAVLLGTLLTKAGHTVRLARAQLPGELAARLLPNLVARHAMARAAPLNLEPDPDVSAVAAAYGLDGDIIERTRHAQEQLVGALFLELEQRVADQTGRLQAAVPLSDPQPEWAERHGSALHALRDHWWVQVMEGGTWRDLDLILQDASGSAPLTPSETVGLGDIAPSLFHELTVRVVVEHAGRGGLEERAVLEHALRPGDLLGEPVVLQIWPGTMPKEISANPDSPHGLGAAALAQDSWTAVLAVGDRAVAHGLLAPESDRPEPAGGNPLGGLGLGVREAVRASEPAADSAPGRELSAAWVEYEIRAPEASPRKYRRAVFDLLGPDVRAGGRTSPLRLDERQRLTRSLALILRTEILALPCRLAPEFVAHLSARSLLANRRVLRELIASWSTPSALELDTLLASAAPAPSPLYTLAQARLDWSRFQDLQYVDRIGLLTRHRHPAVLGEGITVRGSVDIVAKDIGVSLAAPDAFAVRREQGVLDTNAEALWWVGSGLNNTGEAYALTPDWVTLTPDSIARIEALALPADVRTRIRQDLASGLVVVAPDKPVSRGPDHYAGWWRIDPASGSVSGVPGNGWAQCGAEYGLTLQAALIHAARSFMFEYALCQGIAQAFNDFRFVGAELQARGIWFWWVGPISSADPEDVFWASNKGCLIGAMMAGMVSTLPFLIARYNLATAPWILPKPGLLDRLISDKRGAGRFPPGWVKGPIRGRPNPTLPSIQVPEGAGTNPKGYPNPSAPGPRPPAPKPPPKPSAPPPRPPAPPPQPRPDRLSPNAPTSPTPPFPPPGPVTPEVQAAWEDYWRARAGATDAISARTRYNFNNGGDLNDPAFNALDKIANERFAAMNAAQQRLQEAQGAARRAAGKGGFPPPRPRAPAPEPIPVGNENPTIPQLPAPGAAEVGTNGVAGAFDPDP